MAKELEEEDEEEQEWENEQENETQDDGKNTSEGALNININENPLNYFTIRNIFNLNYSNEFFFKISQKYSF